MLQADEMEQREIKPNVEVNEVAIRIKDGSFAWDLEGVPLLSHIDLNVIRGQLIMVVGEVGSGKTSLLCALLGEMVPLSNSDILTAGKC